jgi:cytochrome bd ubiquinol oxidase subunit I
MSTDHDRPMLWLTSLSFPLPFVAILTGWFTAAVRRRRWVVFGVLRTADAMTPLLTMREATISHLISCSVYAFLFPRSADPVGPRGQYWHSVRYS